MRKCDLVYYRQSTADVDLNDLRHTAKIFDALGCDGALNLHLTDKKCQIQYLVRSQPLVLLAKIRNDIWLTNKGTWANTDTRLGHNVFLKEPHPTNWAQ